MSLPHHDDEARKKKDREVLLERFRGEILREAGNRDSLSQVRARILRDSHVTSDPILAQSLRAYIVQREALLVNSSPKSSPPRAQRAVETTHATSPAEVQRQYHDLAVEFDHVVADGNEAVARDLLNRVRELGEAHPNLIDAETLKHFTQSIKDLNLKRQAFNDRIEALAQKAEAAAVAGNDETTAAILKRLYAIHASFPASLPAEQLKAIKEKIVLASDRYDHRRAMHELSSREHAVAAEIRELASAVHRFHVASRTHPHDGETYKQAEAEYRRLLQTVRSHDADWFAALVLELVDFLADWDHPPAKAQHQVDRFLDSIRSALVHMREEIHEIEEDRGAALKAPAKSG